MLKRFLQKSKNQKNTQNPLSSFSSSDFFSASSTPNLINADDIYSTPDKYVLKVSNFSTLVVIFVSVVFGLMLLYNHEIDKKLNSLKTIQDSLILQMASLNDLALTAREIDSKIIQYKNVNNKKTNLSPKIKAAYGAVDSSGTEARVLSFSTTPEKFYISVSSLNPLFFSALFYNYLNSGYISEIHLHTARYDKTSNLYIVEIEGLYK